MAEYDRARALALRLITRKGSAITVLEVQDAQPNMPQQPWRLGEPTLAEHASVAVFLDASELDINGVQEGQQAALIPAQGLALRLDAKYMIKRGSEVWEIEKLMFLKPGDQDILYTAVLKR
jgi:hypothetical protein